MRALEQRAGPRVARGVVVGARSVPPSRAPREAAEPGPAAGTRSAPGADPICQRTTSSPSARSACDDGVAQLRPARGATPAPSGSRCTRNLWCTDVRPARDARRRARPGVRRARRARRSALRWHRAVRSGRLARAARARTRPSSRCRGTSSRGGATRARALPSSGRVDVERAALGEREVLPEVADRVRLLGERVVVGDEEAALAGRQVLARLEREAPARADGPHRLARRTSRRAPAPRPRRRREPCRRATSRSAAMSAAQPCMCTGMIARVRGVIAASAAAGIEAARRRRRRRRTPGSRPPAATASGVATKLYAGTMTSSPARTPAAARATTQRARPAVGQQRVLRADERARTPPRTRRLGRERAREDAAIEHARHRAPLLVADDGPDAGASPARRTGVPPKRARSRSPAPRLDARLTRGPRAPSPRWRGATRP